MTVQFFGGARTVTGSKHLVTLKSGTKFLLDCGLFQGLGTQTQALNAEFGFNAADLQFVILSHAHIDHTGLLPKLVKEGFVGKIYCTGPTAELTQILLLDSAEIQTYQSKKDSADSTPLYSVADVAATLQLFVPVNFNTVLDAHPEVSFVMIPNGHLLGGAAVQLSIKEGNAAINLLYSGDVGRYRSALLPPPQEAAQADYIILESTYGDKHHSITGSVIEDLLGWIKKTCFVKGGQLVIPSFSVGRTQEILYALNQLSLEKRLPQLLYFVDSPMAIKATEVLKSYPHLYNDRMQQVLQMDDDPFHFEGLKYVESVDDSRKIIDYAEPCVIISASGTGDAGRVRHHIEACIGKRQNTILFAGYCGPASTGGQLLSGKEEIDLLTEGMVVKAEVAQLSGMSAHGDADDLTQFVATQDAAQVKKVFLVHGEEKVQQEFSQRLQRKGFDQVVIPAQGDAFELH